MPSLPANHEATTPRLLRHGVARFVTLTAVLGSLADWTLFASLVAIVDERTAGSAWATAAVLLARVLPSTVFAPIAARRVDRSALRAVLATHEAGRVLAVVTIAVVVPSSPLFIAALLLVGLEFAAAILAAGRESLISRHVPAALHTKVNTATAVASYGLLPVGAVLVQLLGPAVALHAAATLYGLLLLAYAVAWPSPARHPGATDVAAVLTEAVGVDGPADAGRAALTRTILAAAVGLAPVVALFTVAPRLAARWLGDATATGLPLGLVLLGGAVGFVLANRRASEARGLGIAAAGFALAAVGLWQPGLLLAGVGAGLSYLALQTRLQAQASDPSEFARAFAILKVSTIVGTLAGPALWALGGPVVLLTTSSLAALVALGLLTDPRPVLRSVVRWVVLRVIRIEVVGERYEGPAVVVSNHPNAVDGVVAMAADPTLRPIVRWQRNRIARAGFWLSASVVTTAGTNRGHRPAYLEAADHLARGGRIWLAPEGGAHRDAVLRAPRTGAVRMAAAAGVPVQVLGIRHAGRYDGPRLAAWRPWRRPVVTLEWGEVLHMTGVVPFDLDRMMHAIAVASDTTWVPSAVAVAA